MIKLCDESSCTQCYACYTICPKHCISMVMNAEGFKSPQIDHSICVNCQLCVKACHVLSPLYEEVQDNSRSKVYATWAKNDLDRTLSSSGGLFSVVAKLILSRQGVVYGAAFSEALKLAHLRVEAKEEIKLLRESKYLISDLEGVFLSVKKDLMNHRDVLFVGTPCQVAGLNKYLNREYDNLYTCDLLCHGVPSYKSFLAYLRLIYTESEIANMVGFHFRYTKGWGYQLSADFKNSKKRKVVSPYDAFYLRAFNKGLMFMKACFKCKYSSQKRIGDITLGDFWDIGSKIPFDKSKKKGISLLLVNTSKGDTIFEQIKGLVVYERRSLQEAIDGNYNLHSPSIYPQGRNTYVYDSFVMTKKELVKKYGLAPSLRDYLRPIKRWLIG